MKRLKHYFFTGLLIVLPVFLTIYILYVIFRLVDSFLGGIINKYLRAELGFAIPGLGFILVIFLILAIGFIASRLLSRTWMLAVEGWFLKLPGTRMVYPSIKQMILFIFSKDKAAFKKVVMIEYPLKGVWSVGFMTNEGFREAQEKAGQELVHVLIGSTPSPWSGFFVMVPKSEVKFLEMSTEEGIKLIVSGGIIKPAEY